MAAKRPDSQTACRGAPRRAFDAETIEICPEPSAAEREAILLALRQAVNRRDEEARPGIAPWAAAGRREALFGRSVKTRGGGEWSAGRVADW